MADRALATRVAWSLHGLPYIWGGDDPILGFDCSGLVIEILRSVGLLAWDGDWTADDLYWKYRHLEQPAAYEGCIAFWRRDGRMSHVEYCIDASHTIGASGGGSATVDSAAAAASNAYIKLRPLRAGAVICDPFQMDGAP